MNAYTYADIHVPYIRNRLQKKLFMDFANLGAFANIYLYFLITESLNF